VNYQLKDLRKGGGGMRRLEMTVNQLTVSTEVLCTHQGHYVKLPRNKMGITVQI
jgi:hypothetical protein